MHITDYVLGAGYYLSLLFPIAGGVFFLKKMSKATKIFFLLTVVAFIVETIALSMALRKTNNYLVYQIYFFIETALIAIIFYRWNERPLIKTIIAAGCALMAIVWIYFNVVVPSKGGFANMPLLIESIVFMLAASHFMINIFIRGKTSIFDDHRFWICLGLLLNFTGNILIYSNLNFVFTQATTLWRFHWVISFLVNGIYAIGFISLKWTDRAARRLTIRGKEAVWEMAD
jgi:cytochrome b561